MYMHARSQEINAGPELIMLSTCYLVSHLSLVLHGILSKCYTCTCVHVPGACAALLTTHRSFRSTSGFLAAFSGISISARVLQHQEQGGRGQRGRTRSGTCSVETRVPP